MKTNGANVPKRSMYLTRLEIIINGEIMYKNDCKENKVMLLRIGSWFEKQISVYY